MIAYMILYKKTFSNVWFAKSNIRIYIFKMKYRRPLILENQSRLLRQSIKEADRVLWKLHLGIPHLLWKEESEVFINSLIFLHFLRENM